MTTILLAVLCILLVIVEITETRKCRWNTGKPKQSGNYLVLVRTPDDTTEYATDKWTGKDWKWFSDIEIVAEEIQKLKKELYTIISEHSKTPYEQVWKDSDRDHWMTAEEAKTYGMIDNVLKKRNEIL